ILTFHHEGFFWRCWFFGEGHPESIWTFWYSDQAHPKFCMHGYLFPMPIAVGPFPHPSYDTTAGEFLSFSPSISQITDEKLQRSFLTFIPGFPAQTKTQFFSLFPGGLFLLLVFLFVMWKEFAADFQRYILLERSERCLDDVPVHVYYGWSFMFAAAGVPLVLLSGLLFFLVGRDI
ncbi:TM182 protein, partial [Agelaius phoeniceus]|nr:TM182 protein [Agelaius phoeniceus]